MPIGGIDVGLYSDYVCLDVEMSSDCKTIYHQHGRYKNVQGQWVYVPFSAEEKICFLEGKKSLEECIKMR